jgi:hypothetical protein
MRPTPHGDSIHLNINARFLRKAQSIQHQSAHKPVFAAQDL